MTHALARPSAASARELFAGVEADRYNPFHLLVADPAEAFLWWYDGENAEFEELGAGLHIVTESSPIGRCPRGEWLRSRWPVDPSPALLRELLATHSSSPLAGTCIHIDTRYGTRSSAVIRLAPSLDNSELYTAAGPPCVTPLEDRSALLSSLSRGA